MDSKKQLSLLPDLVPTVDNVRHCCRAEGCDRMIRRDYLMCGWHWRMVDYATQRAVYFHWEASKLRGKFTQKYLAVVNAAVVQVRYKTAQLQVEKETAAQRMDGLKTLTRPLHGIRQGDHITIGTGKGIPHAGEVAEVLAVNDQLIAARPVVLDLAAPGLMFKPWQVTRSDKPLFCRIFGYDKEDTTTP